MKNENIKSIEMLRDIIIAIEDNDKKNIKKIINEASNYLNQYFVDLNNKELSDDGL